MLYKAVLSTIAYYDALDYPLTGFEVWKHLLIPEGTGNCDPVSLSAVLRILESLEREGRIQQENGFWVASRHKELIALRIRREKIAVEKLKRASRLVRWCSWIPFIRMIALTGSLSMKQGDRESDWDFLVVAKNGGIWTSRFLLTLWLTLLGQRRHGERVSDRACLNCYLTDETLEVPLQDVFSSHEYRFLYPVIGRDVFRNFELANRWIQRYRPHFLPTVTVPFFLRRTSAHVQRFQAWIEFCIPLRWLEPLLARFQKRLIERNPKTHFAGGYISATDRALIFFPEPKGPQVFERFKEQLSRM